MTLNQTFNEASSEFAPDLSGPATHNVRVHFNETDAGLLFGPTTLVGARLLLQVVAGRDGVIKATIEAI